MILALLIVACGEEEKPSRVAPEGILPKDSMAYYLSQVHIMDAAMRHRKVRKGNMQSYAKRGFIEYFDTAGVSHDRFIRSLEFWAEDFEEMSEVYDLAMERISTQMVRLKQEEAKKD